MISRNNIAAAAARIGGHVRHTPIIQVNSVDFGTNVSVTAKLELLQHTGSFKPRGAFNRLLLLSREKIRTRFEQRFTARRMALEYLTAYRSLMDRDVHHLKLVVDAAPVG